MRISHSPTFTPTNSFPSPHLQKSHAQIVLIDAELLMRKLVPREVRGCNSPFINSLHSTFIPDSKVCTCTGFMDEGSLDGIYKQIEPIDIDVMGKDGAGRAGGVDIIV